MQVLLASFEPRRDRTPAGRRFVRKPTRQPSSRQFESQPAETRRRYEHTLTRPTNHPSGMYEGVGSCQGVLQGLWLVGVGVGTRCGCATVIAVCGGWVVDVGGRRVSHQ